VRRSISHPKDLAYYGCFGPAQTPLEELVSVAGRRWAMEESVAAAQGEVGLEQKEVGRWVGWYRPSTLVLGAQAFWAVSRASAGVKGEAGSEKS
jgi:SRSO17 transposase